MADNNTEDKAAENAVDTKAADKQAADTASEEKSEAKSVSDLGDLKEIAGDTPDAGAAAIAQAPSAPLREQELDAQGRA